MMRPFAELLAVLGCAAFVGVLAVADRVTAPTSEVDPPSVPAQPTRQVGPGALQATTGGVRLDPAQLLVLSAVARVTGRQE